MTGATGYRNTDLEIASSSPIEALCKQLDRDCCVIYQERREDGNWHAGIESPVVENTSATEDIQHLLAAISHLSGLAAEQWAQCHIRTFDIGFRGGDTRAVGHSLPPGIVKEIAKADCAIAITLYAAES